MDQVISQRAGPPGSAASDPFLATAVLLSASRRVKSEQQHSSPWWPWRSHSTGRARLPPWPQPRRRRHWPWCLSAATRAAGELERDGVGPTAAATAASHSASSSGSDSREPEGPRGRGCEWGRAGGSPHGAASPHVRVTCWERRRAEGGHTNRREAAPQHRDPLPGEAGTSSGGRPSELRAKGMDGHRGLSPPPARSCHSAHSSSCSGPVESEVRGPRGRLSPPCTGSLPPAPLSTPLVPRLSSPSPPGCPFLQGSWHSLVPARE